MMASLAAVAAAVTVLVSGLARSRAEQTLDASDPVFLAGDLVRLSRSENSGVAFGLFGGSPLVPWLAVLALLGFALLFARPLMGSRAGAGALGLILGGGVANLLDRLGDGRVTDYVDVGLGSWRWPAFNLPDAAITVGFLLAVWALARLETAEEGLP